MPDSDDLEKLQLSVEQMRKLGYRVIDMLVDHFDALPNKRVTKKASRRAIEQKLRDPIPERGLDVDAVLQQQEEGLWFRVDGAYGAVAILSPREAPRLAGMDRALSRQMVEEMITNGFAMRSSTVLRGRSALHLCTINPRTTDSVLEATIGRLQEIGAKLAVAPRY